MRPALRGAIPAASLGAAAILAATPLIAAWEGWVNVGYRDLGGVITSCVGHTKTAVLGRRYTDDECRALLAADLEEHARLIRPCVPAETPVESQAAFLSLAFNIGGGAFCGSTLARKLKAGDLAGACAELSRWNRVKGKPVRGLTNRRAAERALCEKGLGA